MPYYYQLSNIKIPASDRSDALLKEKLEKLLKLEASDILSYRVVKKSLDARKKPHLFYVYTAQVETQRPCKGNLTSSIKTINHFDRKFERPESLSSLKLNTSNKTPIIVVGAGPAGYFSALTLAEAGAKVIILERGKPVETRMKDIGDLRAKGELNPESNVCFGEGGAGAYTDGKLYTRIKHSYVFWVMKRFVDFGASKEILSEAHPHLGTDRLVKIIKTMRDYLKSLGVEIRFETKVENILFREGKVFAVKIEGGEELEAKQVVLAIGHSARDTLEKLDREGVLMEAKPFAVGLRAEHPQEWVDKTQYGRSNCTKQVGAANYQLTGQVEDPRLKERGVYSFCMCPGGFIVPSPTEEGLMAVNGMSNANRSTPFANSGVVAQVTPEDLIAEGYEKSPLMGIGFQRDLEKAAFEATKQSYAAPAMRVTDFVTKKPSGELANSNFRPGIEAVDLWEILPTWVANALLQGLRKFDRKMKGYISSQANLLAVESRTSSPVRIPRNENGSAVNHEGLYPVGEGAGYAGGIISAAVDGVVAAEKILEKLK